MKLKMNNIIKQSSIIALPLFMILIMSPMDIWAGNKTQFAFNWGDFFWIYCGIFFLTVIIMAIITAFLPTKLKIVINKVLFIISVLLYIQVMFLNIRLSSDDGGKMPWDELHSLMMINLVIWIAITVVLVVILLYFEKYSERIMIYSSLFLVSIQLVAVISIIITNISASKYVTETYLFGDEKQFQVANGNNVIVMVLDTFGSAWLDKALEQDPDCLSEFKDFVYYDNADSVYYRTLPSLTHMLTGEEYDVKMTVGNWSEYAWNKDSTWDYYNTLHENEYKCYLYSTGMYYTFVNGNNLVDKFDNIIYGKALVDNKHRKWLISKLTKMSLYKYLPYIFKPYFEVISNELDSIVEAEGEGSAVYDMIDFKSKLEEKGLAISDDNNSLIIHHIGGTHLPLRMDANGNSEKTENTSYGEQARGVLHIVGEYLNELKKIDKYEDSTIMILADHGEWELDDCMDPQIVFFYKGSNEKHSEIQINSSPISNCDVMATIYDSIGLEYSSFGTSILDWKEEDKRERTIFILNDNTLQGWTYNSKEEIFEKAKNEPDIYLDTIMY